MPSTSAKQAKFMRAVAHSPKFAKKVGVSQNVGKDFEMADKKMKKYGSGGWSGRGSVTVPLDEPKPKPRKIPPSSGNVKTTKNFPSPAPVSFGSARKYREDLKKVKVSPSEGKVIESANRSEGGDGMKKGGAMKMKKMMADKAGRAMTKKSADTMGRAMKMNKGGKCYAKGGSVASRADGVAKKGHTKGKMC